MSAEGVLAEEGEEVGLFVDEEVSREDRFIIEAVLARALHVVLDPIALVEVLFID